MLDTYSYKYTHNMKYCFPKHQWLQERASLLGYTYIACLVLLTAAVRAITIFRILNKTNLNLHFTDKSMLRGRL